MAGHSFFIILAIPWQTVNGSGDAVEKSIAETKALAQALS
jgi:hypothetical protein